MELATDSHEYGRYLVVDENSGRVLGSNLTLREATDMRNVDPYVRRVAWQKPGPGIGEAK